MIDFSIEMIIQLILQIWVLHHMARHLVHCVVHLVRKNMDVNEHERLSNITRGLNIFQVYQYFTTYRRYTLIKFEQFS